jgi:hypothetical protein
VGELDEEAGEVRAQTGRPLDYTGQARQDRQVGKDAQGGRVGQVGGTLADVARLSRELSMRVVDACRSVTRQRPAVPAATPFQPPRPPPAS